MTGPTVPACPYCRRAFPMEAAGPQACPSCRRALIAGRGNEAAWFPAEVEGYVLETPADASQPGTLFRTRGVSGTAVRFLPGFAGAIPADRERVGRALDEWQVVDHPHLARLLSHGTEAGVRYCIREWVVGEPLSAVLAECAARRQVVPFDEAYPVFRQLCGVIAALHERGLVHGRIDLDRVVLQPGGAVKLTDPAWRLTPAAQAITLAPHPGASRPSAALPTPADDVLALGRVTYEFLTGIAPGVPARPAALVNFSVPPWFDERLLALLDPDPARRPVSLAALAVRPAATAAASPAVERLAALLAGALVGFGAGAVTAGFMGASVLVGGLVGLVPGAVIAAAVRPAPGAAGPRGSGLPPPGAGPHEPLQNPG